MIVEGDSGRSRGFGFVTFADTEAASAAIQGMDQRVFILFFLGYMLNYTPFNLIITSKMAELYASTVLKLSQTLPSLCYGSV